MESPRSLRRELKKMGFWHATGLPWFDITLDENGFVQAPRGQLGRYYQEDRLIIIYLANGEVWRARRAITPEVRKILRKYCPGGKISALPYPAGALIDQADMEFRFADPSSTCNDNSSPIPDPQ